MQDPSALRRLVNGLADREDRALAADALARALGAESLVILVHDPGADAKVPAPGFPRTLPGGPTWRAFLAACERSGEFVMDVEHPTKGRGKTARAYAAPDGSVTVLISGAPTIGAQILFEELLPVIRLLQTEREAVTARAAASASEMVTEQASALTATVDDHLRRMSSLAVRSREAATCMDIWPLAAFQLESTMSTAKRSLTPLICSSGTTRSLMVVSSAPLA